MALAIDRTRDRLAQRLARGVYTEADAADLEVRLTAAEEAIERLNRCLSALAEERPSLAIEAWHNVDALFAAAYAIGALSEISGAADRFVVEHEQNHRRPRRMRKGRTAKADDEKKLIEQAILECVGGDLSRLRAYRDRLAPSLEDVREKLAQIAPTAKVAKTTVYRTIGQMKRSPAPDA
jgi:hypothetical protein